MPEVPASFKPAKASLLSQNLQNGPSDGVSDCDNYTFLLRLKAANNEKIDVVRLANTAKNTFLVAGNYLFADGHQEGVLFELNPSGALLAQKRITVQNRPVVLQDVVTTSNGSIFISGYFQGGTPEIFISRLTYSFAAVWTVVLPAPEKPKRVTIDFDELENLQLAAALTNSVQYCAVNQSGNLLWFKQLAIGGLTELVGFHQSVGGDVCLVLNVIQNGKPGIQLVTANQVTGDPVLSGYTGNGTEGFHAWAATGFNNRLQVFGWRDQGAGSLTPFRDGINYPNQIEYRYTYSAPVGITATTTGAIDRSGDGIAFYSPVTQEFVLLKHIAYPSISPGLSTKYSIPNGKSIQSICGTYDNGYLAGFNSIDSSEIILLKTDSTGSLSGCGSATIRVGSVFQYYPESIAAPYSILAPVPGASVASPQLTDAAIPYSFDCRNQTCPPAPVEDTCLPTFVKYYKSNTYAEVINNYFMLKNNMHVFHTARLDNLFGTELEVKLGFRLLDERGNVQKSVSIFDDKGSMEGYSFKLSDSRFIFLSNASTLNRQAISMNLIDENLNLLWHRTVVPSESLYSSGMSSGFSDAKMDAQGNIYLVATRMGFMTDSAALLVYKMSPTGDPLWIKYIKTMDANFGTAAIAVSSRNVHVVVESFNGDNISVCLDQANGQVLSTNSFPVRWNNSMLTNKFFYYNGSLYFSGSNRDNQLVLIKFDTTGKVLQIRECLPGTNANSRNAALRDGYLYTEFSTYFNGEGMRGLLKVDTNLDVKFVKYYPHNNSVNGNGIDISPQQYIYIGGNSYYHPINAEAVAYLIKRDSLGNSGTCINFPQPDFLNRTFPAMKPVSFFPGSMSLPDSANSSYFTVDTTSLNVASIACVSVQSCNKLELGTLPPVCQLNSNYTLSYTRNPGCTLKPAITADTAFVKVIDITDTTVVLQFRKNGNIRLFALLNTGCAFFTDSIDIAIQEVPIAINLGQDTLLCPGDTLKLHAGPGYAAYKWQDGSTDSVYISRGPGTYYVEIQNSCGDIRSDTIRISASILPALTLGPDQQVCVTDTVTLQASPGFVQYNWSPATLVSGSGASVKVVPARDTSITVLGITANGCKARDTILLSLKFPPVIQLGNDTSFCASDSITLHAGAGYQQYKWNTGATTENLVIRQAGLYTVTALAPNGCYSKDSLLVLNIYTLPIINLGADRNICENTIIVLNAGNHATYRWQDNSTAPVFNAADTGLYSVQVTNVQGCRGSDSIRIVAKNPNPAGFLIQTDTLCTYDKLEIVPKQTYSSYSWSTGNTTSRVSVTKGGLYTLSVTDANGCKGMDSILVIEKQCLSGMFLPNAFTPNKDGLNDLFRARAYGPLVSFELVVYNRYGQVVFSTKESSRGWDGNIGGQPAEMGNYVWTCTYQFVGRDKEFQRGFVLLIH